MRKLRVVSYNIHKGFCTFNRFTLHRIKEAIRETRADICFLQEVVGYNQIFQNKILTWPTETQFEFLADAIWPHFKYGQNAIFPERHHGNAVLSKYPILMSENLDISTNRFEQRGLLHCQIEVPGVNGSFAVDLFNTHLNLLHSSRLQQSKKIIDWIQPRFSQDRPMIMGGDFNDWNGALTPLFKEGLGVRESFQELTGAHAKSFPSHFPLMTLDRIYSKGLKPVAAKVLTALPWIELSDHLPLFAEFEHD